MPYTPEETAVLIKYKILQPDGVTLRMTKTPAGPMPLMNPETIDRLLALDPTPNKRWLDWIFFQAGGGDDAVKMTIHKLKETKEKFIRQRSEGFRDDTGYHQGIGLEAAKQLWVDNEQRFREFLSVGKEETVAEYNTFGYFRDFPGQKNRYAILEKAMTLYMKVYKHLLAINKDLAKGKDTPIRTPLPDSPEQISDISAMVQTATMVERHVAGTRARTDIRASEIYKDENVLVIAPLTYAAAVHYGYSAWPWADKESFERAITGQHSYGYGGSGDPWKGRTSGGNVIVYFSFRTPMPSWGTPRKGTHDLTDIALVLNAQSASEDPDQWVVYDQENRDVLTVSQVKKMIWNEPIRDRCPDCQGTGKLNGGPCERCNSTGKYEEEPRTPLDDRGANVYSDQREARKVLRSFWKGVRAVKAWLPLYYSKKNKERIKSDVLTLD